MADDAERRVFETALRHQEDKTDQFSGQIGYAIDVESIFKFDSTVQARVREIMLAANDRARFMFDIAERASRMAGEAASILRDGRVAAVDGTNALSHVSLMNTGVYACAVGYVTSRTRPGPNVKITTTSTEFLRKNAFEGSADELAMLCEDLDAARIEQSWTTTFREYQERRVAIDCDASHVFIDGPIFTQNLVTQQSGRALYGEMVASGKTYVGIIKDLSGSWTLSKWCGYSLEPGEGFIVCSLKTQFLDRFKGKEDAIRSWLENDLPDSYVRGVFKPNQKAFGFECRLSDLDLAMALIAADASPTINHELPLLLETVDAHLRGGFDGGAAASVIVGNIQRRDYRMGVDVMNERDFR